MTLYRLQLLQHLTPNYHRFRGDFCASFQDLLDEDDDFLDKLQFSDEATFRVSKKVNKQYIRI